MVYETIGLDYVPEEWLLILLKKRMFVAVKEMLLCVLQIRLQLIWHSPENRPAHLQVGQW